MRIIDPEKHASRRLEILAAARECFARQGFHQTSTAEICARAGISSGKLFHYYPSKKAIIAALVEAEGAEVLAYFQQARQRQSAYQEIRCFLGVVADLAADSAYVRLALEISAEAGRDADIAALVAANDRALRHELAGLVAAAIRHGEIKASQTPKDAADALAILIDGLFNRAGVDPDFDPIRHLPVLLAMADGVLPRPL